MSLALATNRDALSCRVDPIDRSPLGARWRPLRICQVVPYALDENGGVKHHAVQLACALRASGDYVAIVGPALRPHSEAHVHGFKGVFNVTANGSANHIGLFPSFSEVRSFFRSARFDVVHIHEPVVPTLGCWAILSSRGSARVATFHAFAERPNRVLGAFAKLLANMQAPAFHAATAVSHVASSFAGKFWPQPRAIVPNGVSLETFRPPTGARANGPTRLLFVGRIGDRRKGFDHLLHAYATLRARNVSVVLDVVGELGGAELPPALPGLTYHGVLSLGALAERYRNCDVFVAPSTGQESFGIILLEAMASARPIVCSDILGYRDTVDVAGTRLVTPADPSCLANAIAELSAQSDLWPAMGAANLKRAREFSWDDVARRMREVYVDAISARMANRQP